MSLGKLRENIYYLDGSLRDIRALNTNRNDWKNWIELINKNYIVEFYNGQTQKIENRIDQELVFDFWDGKTDLFNTATIKLGSIILKCHFFDEEEIENDFNPLQINSIEDHKILIEYLISVSCAIHKKVIVTPENCSKEKLGLISVENEKIEYYAN